MPTASALGQLLAQGYGNLGTQGSNTAQTWVSWNQVYSTAATTINSVQVWEYWNTQYLTGNQPAHIEECEQDREAARKRLEKAAQDREAAQKRAEEFLLEHLDPHQRESYKKQKMFVVETPAKRRYLLHKDRQVRRLEGQKEVVSYCIHTYGVPREDELLGFKLLLEADEDQFLKTANATRLAA